MKVKRPSTDALRPYIDQVRLQINETNVLESLVEELAVQRWMIDRQTHAVEILRAQMASRDIALPSTVNLYRGNTVAKIDAGMPLKPSSGFHSMEYVENGAPYRWTGPDRLFFFDLHLDRSGPLKFSIQVSGGSDGKAVGLRCLVDNLELPLTTLELPSRIEYSAVLVPRTYPGVTRLSFLVPKVFSPAQLSQSSAADSRILGVIFHQLIVQPATQEETADYFKECDDLTRIQLAALAQFAGHEGTLESEAADDNGEVAS